MADKSSFSKANTPILFTQVDFHDINQCSIKNTRFHCAGNANAKLIMKKLQINLPPWVEIGLRCIQFIASILSLILWAIYLSNLSGSSTSSLRAVMGIVIAGTIWAVAAAGQWAWRKRNEKGNAKRWSTIVGLALAVAVLDFCFIILFATVAGITGPSATGRSGGCRALSGTGAGNNQDGDDNDDNDAVYPQCPKARAVFGFAIVNM